MLTFTINAVREEEILYGIAQSVDCAAKYYKLIGYWGELDFRTYLNNIHGCIYLPGTQTNGTFFSPDSEVLYSAVVHSAKIEAEEPRLVFETGRVIGWTFGRDFTQEHYDKFRRALHRKKPRN
jgi:hypothetical protein